MQLHNNKFMYIALLKRKFRNCVDGQSKSSILRTAESQRVCPNINKTRKKVKKKRNQNARLLTAKATEEIKAINI